MAVGPVVLLLILNAVIIFSLRHAELETVIKSPKHQNNEKSLSLIVETNYYNMPKTQILSSTINKNDNKKNEICYDKKRLEKVELKINSESMPLLNNTLLKNCPKSPPPSTAPPSFLPALSNGCINTATFLTTAAATPIMPCVAETRLYNNNNSSSLSNIKLNNKDVENDKDNEENESATDIMTLVLVVCLFISCNILVSINFIILNFISYKIIIQGELFIYSNFLYVNRFRQKNGG